MGKEEELLEHWRELAPEKQQKVLEFVELLKSESKTTPPESDFVPQTPKRQEIMGNPTTSDRCWVATAQRRRN